MSATLIRNRFDSKPVRKLLASTRDYIDPEVIKQRVITTNEDTIVISKEAARSSRVLTAENYRPDSVSARAARRQWLIEHRRQNNIESIVEQAVRYLPTKVSENPTDSDWIANFFESCRNIGNREMQMVWSRLLAGEIAEPKSYSLRIIQTVKVLSQEDALLFAKVCSFCVNHNRDYFFLRGKPESLAEKKGVKFAHLLHFHSYNLIHTNNDLSIKFDPGTTLSYFDNAFKVRNKRPGTAIDGPAVLCSFPLSDIGNQLARICGATMDEEFDAFLKLNFEEIPAVSVPNGAFK